MKYTFRDLREVMNEDDSMDHLLMAYWRKKEWLLENEEKDIKNKMFLVGRKKSYIIDELEKENKNLKDELHSLKWKIKCLYSEIKDCHE